MNALSMAPFGLLALPLLSGAVLARLEPRRVAVGRAISAVSFLLQLLLAATLVAEQLHDAPVAVRVAAGVLLVLDRLSAWMILAAAAIALTAFCYDAAAGQRWSARVASLLHIQLFLAVAGYLVADLASLWLCTEASLLLALLPAYRAARRASPTDGPTFLTVKIAATLAGALALACIYLTTGTFDLASLAAIAPTVAAGDAALLHGAQLGLLVVLVLTAAGMPLLMWAPRSHAALPASSLLLCVVQCGLAIYVLLRLYTLVFPCVAAGPCAAPGLALPLGLATLMTAVLGAFGVERLRSMAACLLIMMLGLTLIAAGNFRAGGLAVAVFYLMHLTLTGAALLLAADLVMRSKPEPLAAPRRRAAWSIASLAGASAIGLPPSSGFVGLIALLQASVADALPVWTLLSSSTLVALAALLKRANVVPRAADSDLGNGGPQPRQLAVAGALLVALAMLSIAAAPALDFARATAQQLLDRRAYLESVARVR